MKTHKGGIKDTREVKRHVRSRKKGEREKGWDISSTRMSSLTGDRKEKKKGAYGADMMRTRFQTALTMQSAPSEVFDDAPSTWHDNLGM